MSTDFLEFFAPCPRGTEKLLAEELRSLRCRSVRPPRAGVSFAGPIEVAYRACLWSRIASRVLLTLARVPAVDDVQRRSPGAVVVQQVSVKFGHDRRGVAQQGPHR